MKIKVLMQNGGIYTSYNVRAVHVDGYGTIEDRDGTLVLDISSDSENTMDTVKNHAADS